MADCASVGFKGRSLTEVNILGKHGFHVIGVVRPGDRANGRKVPIENDSAAEYTHVIVGGIS